MCTGTDASTPGSPGRSWASRPSRAWRSATLRVGAHPWLALAHDEIIGTDEGIRRASGRSGGTEGGMSTGEVLRVRAAMKPISTIPRALQTVDVTTGEPATAINQRSDVCAVPAAGVVAEAMVALVLADAVVEKFGGDSVRETGATSRPISSTSASADAAAVVIVGPPGAGKTTVGRALARRLRVGFRDTDADVEAVAGLSVADVFIEHGEPRFRGSRPPRCNAR